MKKRYVKPVMVGEEFLANEFVSACGKTESGEYIFTCDAPAGDAYRRKSAMWGGSYWDYFGSFHPCDAKHKTTNPNSYETRAIDINDDGKIDEKTETFLYWYGPDSQGRTGHFTASLTAEMVETVRS